THAPAPADAVPRATVGGMAAPPAAAPAPTRRPAGAYVGGRALVGQRHKDHPYTDAERAQHCLRYGVGVGRTVQCRYPPGDPYNEPEWGGTPTAEGAPR
ncbi:MAG TPA: hypothetical protein VNA20_14690, partial [Frankiaceae bacterium]|nr:hypothetical protein [Frankiaceae bacterium]